ncbi:MAG: AAA family ATPase [Verrucomicrobia bacterium]|nr:AAA family ATPase [Verrucomicrobiota bacterium]
MISVSFYAAAMGADSQTSQTEGGQPLPPEIEWLQRRWGTSRQATWIVAQLLEAEARGSTATQHNFNFSQWGNELTQCDPLTITTDEVAAIRSPLVALKGSKLDYLQSTRLFQIEHAIRKRLALAARQPDNSPIPQTEAILPVLFPDCAPDNRQLQAVRLALKRNFCWITGGPGTGKTYTLARILTTLLEAGIPANNVYLGAPTGKAAQRMRAAIAESLQSLPEEFKQHKEALLHSANSCNTLHSLLRYNPGTRRCARLSFPEGSVVVVDECSMIDIFMWHALLKAVPPTARLILMGDPQQLESVGKGNVFAELFKMAADPPCDQLHVHLNQSRRFANRPGIKRLAASLEADNADEAMDVLLANRQKQDSSGLSWIESERGWIPVNRFPGQLLQSLRAVAEAATPELALQNLDKVCILTANRCAIAGAESVSRHIDEYLRSCSQLINSPIIINRQ